MIKGLGAAASAAADLITKAVADLSYSKLTVDGVFQSTLDISSVPASYALSLSADLTTTSTTIVDATGLIVSSVPVGTYLLDAYLIDQSSVTTGGPRFGVGGTATCSVTNFTVEQATSATSRTTSIGTAVNTLYGTTVATATTSFGCNLHARISVTAAGSLGLRWAVSSAATGTLKAGSYLVLTRTS